MRIAMISAIGAAMCGSALLLGWTNTVRSNDQSGVAKTTVSIGGQANPAAFSVNGVPGFTGSKTVGSCTITVSSGIVTNITGC